MTSFNKIVLIGFMGSGKSTLGKKLANQLNYQFIDLDKVVEEKSGLTISEIFETKGEASFRELETEELKNILSTNQKIVLAVGGGTPCFNNNIGLINESSLSIYIKYNAGILTSRLINAKTERPLISNKPKEELEQFVKELLEKREGFYLKSKKVIEGNNITVNQLMKLLF